MFCAACGAGTPTGASFCLSCGSATDSAPEPAPAGGATFSGIRCDLGTAVRHGVAGVLVSEAAFAVVAGALATGEEVLERLAGLSPADPPAALSTESSVSDPSPLMTLRRVRVIGGERLWPIAMTSGVKAWRGRHGLCSMPTWQAGTPIRGEGPGVPSSWALWPCSWPSRHRRSRWCGAEELAPAGGVGSRPGRPDAHGGSLRRRLAARGGDGRSTTGGPRRQAAPRRPAGTGRQARTRRQAGKRRHPRLHPAASGPSAPR